MKIGPKIGPKSGRMHVGRGGWTYYSEILLDINRQTDKQITTTTVPDNRLMLDSIRSCSCNGSMTNGLECIHTNRQIATTVSVNRFVLNSIGSRSCKLWLYMLWNIVTCCDTLWYAAICSDVLLTHRQASILWKWWWYAAIYSEMLWYVVINYRYILSFPPVYDSKKNPSGPTAKACF